MGLYTGHLQTDNMAEDLQKLDSWLNKTEERLDGGKIQRPGSIVDACQALSKARDLRAEFDKREKPLTIVKELVGDADPEIKAFATKFERIKNLSEFYLSKIEVLCVIWPVDRSTLTSPPSRRRYRPRAPS